MKEKSRKELAYMPEHVREEPKKIRVHFDTTDQKGKERGAKNLNYKDKNPFLKGRL